MPKRSAEDQIVFYRKKIKKLQTKEDKRRRRIIVYSDSSDCEEKSEIGTNVTENNENNLNTVQLDYDHVDENLPDSAQIEITGKAPIFGQPLPSLDPEFLIALGELVPEQVTYGEDIHPDLAQRWAPILRRGLTEKDQKDKIIKDYATPKNCKLFSAPILNPEIAAAVSEFARTRDKKN
ncbi:unnamed protein product [Parnassius mnemosyne]|uniref:Uncharacterized protein n=1 Tax=Parnassius mnemosyne TaxID=213953 RepID=A0AAV1M0F8_9NEOP